MFRTIVYKEPTEQVKQLESKLASKVIIILKKSQLRKSQISIELGHKKISGELNKQVNRLLKMELIEQTIPDKPNSGLQKYRLTPKALEVITQLEILNKNENDK